MTENKLPQWNEPANVKDAAVLISNLGRNMHEHAYLVGRTLSWVKKQVGHGAFLTWVEKNVWFGHDTAQRMMSFAGKCEVARQMLEYHTPKNRLKRFLVEPESPTCEIADLAALADSGKKFGTIYADPPWEYDNRATRSAADGEYSTLTPIEVAALPIEKLAADQAHLHLWTTNAFLFDCQEIIKAWGFEYKSIFVWVKPQMGIGNYWRVSHELLLLGVRGGLTFQDKGLMSWLLAERGEHSVKPEKVRLLIEKASPGPRLELFARRCSENWAVWGNEIERDIFTREVVTL